MPDLGDYAGQVVACYVITIGLLTVLVAMTMIRARRVRAELEEIERSNV